MNLEGAKARYDCGEKSAIGTALNYTNSNSYDDYVKIVFGTEAKVACTGDIRTLVDYENYATANTEKTRFCGLIENCTTLTTAPELPATTLAHSCYYQMFTGCTKLNQITMLATDISVANCLANWVTGVASTGTFVKAKNMTSLPSGGIPTGWTVRDQAENNE